MVKVVGGRSGFKTVRDLVLFGLGVFGCAYHLVSAGGDVQLPILIFFAGIAGSPYVLSKDESKESIK